jgi:hypothetical protein
VLYLNYVVQKCKEGNFPLYEYFKFLYKGGGSFPIMHKEVHGTNLEQIASWTCPTTQEMSGILCNSKVHYRVHKSPSTGLYPETNKSNPHLPFLLKVHFNIILTSMPMSIYVSLSYGFPYLNFVNTLSPHACYISCASRPHYL